MRQPQVIRPLPRLRSRGSIEGCTARPAQCVEQRWLLSFRGFAAAAPLKDHRRRRQDRATRIHGFRGFAAAAPLKGREVAEGQEGSARFRGFAAAAPLKTRTLACRACSQTLPRLRSRGSIEGEPLWERVGRLPCFRGFAAAAPLKALLRHPGALDNELPRLRRPRLLEG